jgi:F1F0 ATPase subunit 2
MDGSLWGAELGAFGAGLLLGWIYFGGLWWTVRRLPEWRQPALAFFISFLLRTLVVAGLLVLIARMHWALLLGALAGMLVVRVYLTRRIGPARRLPLDAGLTVEK